MDKVKQVCSEDRIQEDYHVRYKKLFEETSTSKLLAILMLATELAPIQKSKIL